MIRRCCPADKEIWCRLNKEFMSYEYQEENVWEDPMQKGEPEVIFEEVMKDKDSPNVLLLIEEEGEVIGFINAAYFISVWAHGRALFIDDFFIRERFRGRGYGSKALRELESLLKDQGYVRIQLWAEETNPKAVDFYRKENYGEQKIHFFCKYL